MKTRKYLSCALQVIVAACSAAGIILTTMLAGNDFMGGATTFLYFTIQSNIWIGVTCLIFAACNIICLIRRGDNASFPAWAYVIKYVFTVSITLTGIVFCFVLAPTMPGAFSSAANVLTHVAVPVAAVADLFIGTSIKLKTINFLWALIPPVYYVLFAATGFVCNWDFGGGNNYPYFFLNWNSPAGAFGFADGMYFMGSFYWVIVLLAFISAMSIGYIALMRKTAFPQSAAADINAQ